MVAVNEVNIQGSLGCCISVQQSKTFRKCKVLVKIVGFSAHAS